MTRKRHKRMLLAMFCAPFSLPICADMAVAQTQTNAPVQLACTGSDRVPSHDLNALCTDFQKAVAAQYPSIDFVWSDSGPTGAVPFVTFEAFSATKTGFEARLTWQTTATNAGFGPRQSFSISDKDMTPALQMNFISRLVTDARLPL